MIFQNAVLQYKNNVMQRRHETNVQLERRFISEDHIRQVTVPCNKWSHYSGRHIAIPVVHVV